MIQKKSTFFLGFFIFLIPFLGFPGFWKTVFTIASGLSLVALSIKLSVPKKTTRLKPRREKTSYTVENIPVEQIKNMEIKPEPVAIETPIPHTPTRRRKVEKVETKQ
jgi:hypothetical protein